MAMVGDMIFEFPLGFINGPSVVVTRVNDGGTRRRGDVRIKRSTQRLKRSGAIHYPARLELVDGVL